MNRVDRIRNLASRRFLRNLEIVNNNINSTQNIQNIQNINSYNYYLSILFIILSFIMEYER